MGCKTTTRSDYRLQATEGRAFFRSLDEEDEIAQAWADEAERRYEELRSGAVHSVPAEEVFARIRARPQ
ncbi:MAG: addiction module protein [Gemmatimonadetes bacterium]|nr:addiction module protein [Gemmatimonadota bacterium]